MPDDRTAGLPDPAIDPVAIHFANCLVTRDALGGKVAAIAKGDCCIMLQLVRMKIDSPSTVINPKNPGRFRGTTTLSTDMRTVLGEQPRLHVPKWGATHVRGDLRDDDRRGNKRHLIRLIELLNVYTGTADQLTHVYHHCIRLHHQFWDGFSLQVTVQEDDPAQKRLFQLLALPTLGRVQQGLIYSALRRRFGTGRRITTKKTFAGDDQSSQSGTLQRGDVQVWSEDAVAISLEVKDAEINETAWERVEQTHGQHDYALFVLGTSYRPADLQFEISGYANTFAVHLADYLMTLVFTISADERVSSSSVMDDIVTIYNSEFCDTVERDASIKIKFDVEPATDEVGGSAKE